METPTLSQLDYAPPLPWHRKLRSRNFALGVLVVVVAIGVLLASPWLWQRAQLLYWQRQCLTYTPSANHVIFERRPEEARALAVSGTGYTAVDKAAYKVAEPWTRFYGASGRAFRSSGTVFLHERQTPSGERRLVVVDLAVSGTSYDFSVDPVHLGVYSRVFSVGSLVRPPVQIPSNSHLAMMVATTVYAGQPDPADPSHFTIEYERVGQRHTLDGWLRDDDTVIIESRD